MSVIVLPLYSLIILATYLEGEASTKLTQQLIYLFERLRFITEFDNTVLMIMII